MNTLPYSMNPKFHPKYWKTEHTSNYLTLYQLNLLKTKYTQKSTQLKNPFSHSKIS